MAWRHRARQDRRACEPQFSAAIEGLLFVCENSLALNQFSASPSPREGRESPLMQEYCILLKDRLRNSVDDDNNVSQFPRISHEPIRSGKRLVCHSAKRAQSPRMCASLQSVFLLTSYKSRVLVLVSAIRIVQPIRDSPLSLARSLIEQEPRSKTIHSTLKGGLYFSRKEAKLEAPGSNHRRFSPEIHLERHPDPEVCQFFQTRREITWGRIDYEIISNLLNSFRLY